VLNIYCYRISVYSVESNKVEMFLFRYKRGCIIKNSHACVNKQALLIERIKKIAKS
jgi:hypothetical protein